MKESGQTHKMWKGLLVIFWISTVEAATPTGCINDESDSSVSHYLCDMSSFSTGSPIPFAGFTDSEPQRLTLYNAGGSLSAGYFNGFSAFAVNNLNEDYPATLQLLCTSTLTVAASTFADFGYMEEMHVKDCTTSLIASMFSGIGTVNRLSFTGGTFSAIDAGTFTGLTIEPIASVADPKGELIIKNVVLTPGTFPSTFFSALTTIKRIYLENLGLTAVDASWFTSNTALVYLSLADNQITSLPADVFNGVNALLYVKLEGDPLDCTGSSTVWYYDYAVTNNITFDGAAVCDTPADQQGNSLAVWAKAQITSTDACNGEMGVVAGDSCINLFQLICFSLTFVCLVFGIVSLVLVLYLRRSTLRAKQDNLNRGKGNQRSKGKPNGKSKGKNRRESNAWA